MGQNIIAVNIGSYGRHRDGAFAHLESLGIRHVEIPVPAGDQVEATQRRLREHGLSATSLTCPCDLAAEPETLREKLEAGRAMGVEIFFISTKAGDIPKPEAYRRLRARAELAEEYGITLSLETHPDLGENATEARATLHAVAHPRLRWNLDTANLYYYNQNVDAVEQARRGADLIRSVHLKDTNGATRCWWFPALGEGVVDFAGVFGVLAARGFRGPYTFELEGIQGEELDEAAARERVAKSYRHLQGLGLA
jgi:sugar phosphate isomerase/epimerase